MNSKKGTICIKQIESKINIIEKHSKIDIVGYSGRDDSPCDHQSYSR